MNLYDELDGEIIDWSLRMVRENRVDFSQWEYDIDYWFRHFFWRNELGEWAIDLMRCHVAFLGGGAASIDSDYRKHIDIVRDYFEYEKRRNKRNRCGMVMYGLMLYALKRTGYKYQPSDDDDDNEWRQTDKILGYLMNGLYEVLIALARGGDFPPINCENMPLESVIESVKAGACRRFPNS